ncbi:MAG TPA: serine protease [Candidatus Paceibacterota bacterium]|nr:serine protease [Candidatus Paceibacterota bacterium]
MLQHFLSIAGALLVTFIATVSNHAGDFRTPPNLSDMDAVEEVVLAQPTVPTPFEQVIEDIVKNASSTPAVPGTTTPPLSPAKPAGPITPTTPTPLPPLTLPVTPPPPPTTPVVPQVDATLSDEALLRAAIVNIICFSTDGTSGVSGSGVIVDPRGIVVTVSHIAQHFLLRDYPSEDAGVCYIRTGSPAKNAYTAEPIFISPTWIEENSTAFLTSRPRGTGEHDFAFLAITGSLTKTPLPARFDHIPLAPANTEVEEGERVGTGSYAAEFLTSSQVRSSLYPTIKFADVKDVLTFDHQTPGLISVAAGSAAQEGSSGGAVMNSDDRLVGVITTRTVKPDLSLRTLQALTMDHIRSSFRADMGENLDAYLKSDLSTLIVKFRGKAVGLFDILMEAVEECEEDRAGC